MEDYNIVKDDFNKISEITEPKWNHNNCYFRYLLKNVDDNIAVALDIGCGKGELSFLLSKKAKKVIAVDLADKIIDAAKKKYNNIENITFLTANILDMNFEDNSLDLIITTATAHHLPYEWLMKFAKSKLKSGGKLIILDLYKQRTMLEYLSNGIAFTANIALNLIHNGSIYKDDEHSRKVWEEHGKHDTYMTIKEIKGIADKVLLNPKVKRKLLWRYILMWEKQ